jgi:hypothetical protein
VPTVRIGRRWRNPPVTLVEIRAAPVETLAVGEPEEDVDGKDDGAVCNRS